MCCFCDTESTIKCVTVRMVVNLLHTTDGKSAAFVCAYCLVCAVAADRAARARGPGHPRVSIRRGASIKKIALIDNLWSRPWEHPVKIEFHMSLLRATSVRTTLLSWLMPPSGR